MPLDADEAARWAATLADARAHARTIAPISDAVSLDLDDAYAIQQLLTQRRLAAGQRVVGWKLGYTSLAMRRQMGIDQPNFGPLTDAMVAADGAELSTGLLQPRVEPEILLRLGRPLEGDVTVADVLAATDAAHASLEVVDSVFAGYRFTLEDNTADGSSASHVVVGPALAGLDRLDAVTVVLRHDGVEVARATGAAASGHPAAGVVWLVSRLAERGLRLDAGDIVITGGLTAAVPLAPGQRVEATFDDTVSVSVARSPT